MRTPDIFLVGAPKCGTSAMYEALRQHPDIFMPERKEPHYFGLVQRRERRPLDATLRAALQAEMVPSIERLSHMLDRDLTGWCRS